MNEPTPAEEVDTGQAQGPTMSLDTTTNTVSLSWPDGRPEEVIVRTEALEDFVRVRNDLAHQLEQVGHNAREASKSLTEMSAALLRAQAVLRKFRLGHSVNKDDWESVGMFQVGGTELRMGG